MLVFCFKKGKKASKNLENILVFKKVKAIILFPALFVSSTIFNLCFVSQVHPLLYVCVNFTEDKNQVLLDIWYIA